MRTKYEIFKGMDETLFFIKCKLSFEFFVKEVIGIGIEEYQLQWVHALENNKRVAITAFTGAGKTATVGYWYPLWKVFTGSNWQCLIVSKSMKQSTKILEEIMEIVNNNEVLMDLKSNNLKENTSQFYTRNRCKISCVPNTISIRGYHVDYVLADEASSYDDHDLYFRYIETRVNSKQGTLCAISTLSDSNDLMSKLNINPVYIKITTACYDEHNNTISKRFPIEYLDGIKLNIGDMAFRKEYLCDVSVVLDAIFPPDLVASCFDNNIGFTLTKEDYKGIIYIGCDFAYSITGDYSVFTVVDVFNDTITIRHMERHRGMPIDEQKERIRFLYQILDPASILVDESNFGQSIYQDLLNEGLPILGQNFAPINRKNILQLLVLKMVAGKLVIPHKEDELTTHIIDQLKKELTSFKKKKTPAGQETYQADCAHDDCLEADTLIKTKRGWIQIKDVLVGDLVLTHKNRYRKVLNCNKRRIRNNEKMYSIISTGRPKLNITGNHSLYVANKKLNIKHRPVNYRDTIINQNCCYYDNEQWLETKLLQPKSYGTIYPINKEIKPHIIDLTKYAPDSYCVEHGKLVSYMKSPMTAFTKIKNPKSIALKSKIIVDEPFGFVLGYFAAEGTTGSHNVSFSSHVKEVGIRDYVNSYFTKLGLNVFKQTRGNGTALSFGSIILRNFFYENFHRCEIKKYPLFVETLPLNIQQNILIGHAIGDGCFTMGALSINTISHVMAYQLFDMFARCGYIVSLKRVTVKNGRHTQWCLSMGVPETNKFLKTIPKKLLIGKTVNKKQFINNQTTIKSYADYLYSPIRSINSIKPSEHVYNLHVEDDESYVANGYIVHNCVVSFALAIKATVSFQPFESFIATDYKPLTDKEKLRTNTSLIASQ